MFFIDGKSKIDIEYFTSCAVSVIFQDAVGEYIWHLSYVTIKLSLLL